MTDQSTEVDALKSGVETGVLDALEAQSRESERALEQQLRTLTGTDYRSRGLDKDQIAKVIEDAPPDPAARRIAVSAARRDYLQDRYKEHRGRWARRTQRHMNSSRGLDRFISAPGDRYHLDDLVRASAQEHQREQEQMTLGELEAQGRQRLATAQQASQARVEEIRRKQGGGDVE